MIYPSHCSHALKRIAYETTTDAPVHTECGRIESAEFSTTIYSSSFLNKITITFTKLSFPFLKCFSHPIYHPLLCTPWSVALFPLKDEMTITEGEKAKQSPLKSSLILPLNLPYRPLQSSSFAISSKLELFTVHWATEEFGIQFFYLAIFIFKVFSL